MSTRLRKPSRLKQLVITALLLAFQLYLGVSALTGQFGIASQMNMEQDIVALAAQSATLDAEIGAIRHKVSLFDPKKLDPDILTERARAQLSMADPQDWLIVTKKPKRNFPPVKSAY